MTVKLQTLYTGRIIKLNLESVILPNGQETELEIVHHPGGVMVMAQDERQRLCLIRQYRHAVGTWLWEFPAGKLELGEAPALTAQRELLEEAGLEASTWSKLGETVSSPGVFTEIIHIFYAKQLKQKIPAHEADEVIEIHWFTLAEIEDMVQQGLIVDAKTLVGLYLFRNQITSLTLDD